MKKIGYLLLMLVMPLFLWAQEPSITVTVKKQVVVGEQFRIAFETNCEGRRFKAPSFEGFTVVGGPFNSTSSSVQIVNGSMTRTVSNTYSYVLRADQQGTFTIGAASMSVDGEEVTSQPVQITVNDGGSSGTQAQGGQQGSSSSSSSSSGTQDPQVSGQDLFLKVIPSKRSAYVGEPVVLTYKLYTRVPVSQLSISKTPSYGGFWTKDFNDNNGGNLRQSSETVNGIEYTTAEVKKVVLIPQKAGKLTIEPMGLECIAQIQTQRSGRRSNDPFDVFFNDPFFSRSYTNVQKTLETSTLSFDAKSLPDSGKPASFTGAVGNYNFTANIDRSQVSTNEAITLTMTVSGSGNIELLNLPQPVFPPDFEVYDPKVTTSSEANGQGVTGTKKVEYLIIPRRAGNFSIPALEFAYFNPSRTAYSVLRSPQMDIQVARGEGDESSGGVYASTQEGIKYLGSDIRHIVTGKANLKPVNSYFFASVGYFVILLALLLVFIVVLLLVRKQRQFKRNTVLVRNKKATKVAKGRLKNANKYLKDKDQNHFYEEMSQALWGYISDKLGIERSVLSMDTVKEAMMAKGIDEALSNEFVDTLNTCEFARFAPGDAAAKMAELYEKGLDVIMKVEKAI